MKNIFLNIFRVRYFLIAILFITIFILILNPNNLYEKGEYFKTEYTEILSTSSYQFLPENPYWDIVLLRESSGKIEFDYMNLSTNKIKQIERLNYSTNSEIDKNSSFLYYDKENEIVYTVLTNNGNTYELFELNQPDKQSLRTKSYNIYKHDSYESLKTLGTITINSIKFYPYKVLTNPKKECDVKPYKDGFRFEFSVDMITSLVGYKYYNEIETDYEHKRVAQLLSKKLGKKFEALDIYKIIIYFRRNSYYNKQLFSKPDYEKRGFLPAKILGKIDINNDNKKDFLILICGHRFLNDKLLGIDAENKEIIFEKEFAPCLNEYQIVDIDGDNVEEILLSFYSPCFEFPFDWHENKTPSVNYKARFYILDSGFNIIEIDNNIAIESEPGFYHYRFLYLKETDKIILGLHSSFDNSDKKLLLYDIKSDKIDTLDIKYQNLCGISKDEEEIILWNFVSNEIAKTTLDRNFKIKKTIKRKVEKKYTHLKQEKIIINKHEYTILDPLTIIDNNLNIIYSPEQKICAGTTTWKGSDCYFIEVKDEQRFLSKLHFERNLTLNPYMIIFLLTEMLFLILYLMISQQIAIPISSPNKNYFILYNYWGKLFYWKIKGKMSKSNDLPKSISKTYDTPNSILNELSATPLLIYKKNFIIFKYSVYEIQSRDESEIIQRISHDLKNQVLMMKLLTEQFTDQISTQNKAYLDQVSSSLKNISSAAQTLSNFSHIDKLYKEEIELNSFISKLLMNHINHNLFGNIKYTPYREEINVMLDENLCRIAFNNLIKNALDEIEEKEVINVIVDQKDNKIILRISNPYHNKDRDSTEFGKVGFSTKPEGSGIGLPISRVIIEKHEGELEYFIKDELFIVEISLSGKLS